MSNIDPGPLATYNSLMDPNLIGYFNNSRMRKHLRKSGLITRRGEIVSETTYRLSMARKEHKRHVRDMLAQAIVHKALDMERGRQNQIRKKLDEISKIELVRRIKDERARKGDEELLPYLSPRQSRPRRPSSVPSNHSQKRWRPTSAPSDGHDHYPIHIDASGPVQKKSPKSREETITPMPPKSPRSSTNTPRRWLKVPYDSQGKPFKMTNRGSLALHRDEPPMTHQIQVNSNCKVTMRYHGSNIHLDYEKFDPKDHIMIEQQHCGGNTLVAFSEKIEPGTDFNFISKRHYGYPFSLTLYIDGVKDSRVSACCEYRHRMGLKLGSRLGHFSIISITGASPCYKCNLEKKVKKSKPKKEKPVAVSEPAPQKAEDEKEIIGLGDHKDTGSTKYKVSVEDNEEIYSSDHETYTDDSSSSSSSEAEDDYSSDTVEEDDEDNTTSKVNGRESPDSEKKTVLRSEAELEKAVEATEIANSMSNSENEIAEITEERELEAEETKEVIVLDSIAEEVASVKSDQPNDKVEQNKSAAQLDDKFRDGKDNIFDYESDTRSESSMTSSRSSSSSERSTPRASKPETKTERHQKDAVITTNSETPSSENPDVIDKKPESVAIVQTPAADSDSKVESVVVTNGENNVNSESKKTSEEETNDGPHSGSGEDTLKREVAEEMQRVLQENSNEDANNREEAYTPRSDSSDSSTSSSSSSSSSDSSSYVSDAETEDKLTALKKKAATSGVTSAPETNTESEDQAGGNDPDNVLGEKTTLSLSSKLERSNIHPGSIRTLVSGQKEIDLTSINLSKQQVRELSQTLKDTNEVESLVLRNGGVTNDDLAELTASLTAASGKIKMLNLNCNDIGPEGVSSIISLLTERRQLEMLLLHGNPLGDEGVTLLVEGLEKIHTSGRHGDSNLQDTSDDSLAHQPIEETASHIVATAIDRAVRSESPAVTGLNLTQLDLGDVQMRDGGALEVARLIELNTNISSLSMTGSTEIGIIGWSAIGRALSINDKIETLSLDYSDLSKEAIRAVINGLRDNTKLTDLDLEGNKIDDEIALEILDMLTENKTLSDITLMPGNQISDSVLQQIRDQLDQN